MAGAVAGELQDAESCAAEGQLRGVGGDDDVGDEALLQKIFPAAAVGQGDVVGAVGVGVHGDARLDDLRGGHGAIAVLEIADVAGVVKMGVGAEDALELKAIVLQQMGQAAAIQLGVARVQQDYVRVVQLIQRQQRRGTNSHIGAAQNMAKLHEDRPPLYSFIISHRRRKTRAGFCENFIYKRRKIR